MPGFKKLFVANWKENKGFDEGMHHFVSFLSLLKAGPPAGKEIIFCPPYPFLSSFRKILEDSALRDLVRLGSQDVSRFESGAHTGEVSAKLLRGLVEFSLVGHSERRRLFAEDYGCVNDKVNLCQKYGITPIVCVSTQEEVSSLIFDRSKPLVLAFEPIGSIGSGRPEKPQRIKNFLEGVRPILGGQVHLLYGGSVDESNFALFKESSFIDGFLVGRASLDPTSFFKLVKQL